MDLSTIIILVYLIVLVFVCLRIIFETHSSTKTLAYLFFCIFVPFVGVVFYLTFGINYWRNKLYNKKQQKDWRILDNLAKSIEQYEKAFLTKKDISITQNAELASMLVNDLNSSLSRGNQVKLLLNGEEKFPDLIKCIEEAKHHIHLEYYIYANDEIGSFIIDLLIKKAKEGVEVRFIYDDFGSRQINQKVEKRMKEAGIQVYPFHKVIFYLLANRINYRNHRKIAVIDGRTAFVGGINVSDKYINSNSSELYWRDTHLRIDGPGVYYLQYLFITDWNFCCPDELIPDSKYFNMNFNKDSDVFVQIAASGPDSSQPTILFSILQAIYLAKEEILITTPYFIPGDNIIDALRIAAVSGLSVKLLVPGISDSRFVNAASKVHYSELLKAGVEIYLYAKGFVHAKTLVTDGKLSMIGTANMDHRSFEYNFEVNAIVYDTNFSQQLRNVFFDDLSNAKKIDPQLWEKRSFLTKFGEKIAKLFSPTL